MKRPARSAGQTIANGNVSLTLDGTTGALVSLKNLRSGNEYLQARAAGGNLFAVYHDFTALFDVTGSGTTPRTAADPESITRSVFAPGRQLRVGFKRRETGKAKRLTATYSGPRWKAELRLSLAEGSTRVACDLAVTNVGDIPASLMAVFPFVSGLRLGAGRHNRMVTLNEAGYIRPLWCDYHGGIYGNSGQMSMQWGSVFDDESGDGFGFIVRDAELRNKDIRYRKPSIEVRYFPPTTLFPGETLHLPRTDLMVYRGDWKPAAEAYHEWFTSAFGPVRHPAWIRTLDSHIGQWFRKRTKLSPPSGEDGLTNYLSSFEELPGVYRRLPVSCIEFAFHGQGCSRLRSILGERRYRHTDGDNVLRSDLGGAQALRKGIRLTHGLGMRFSFYVEGYIVPFDAEIISKRGALAWTVMNRDGTYLGNYTREGFVHMCPGCAEWQDHLASVSTRLVRETGADGVRLDSLGFYFYPCFNPAHHHRSPWDFNLWMDELLRKVARAVRAVNPDCLLTTEAGVDFYSRHFNGALTQQWHPTEVVSVTTDVAPMRVALPEYFMIPHNPCGPLAAALMGYPGGSGGSRAGGRMTELDKLWRSVRYAAAETIRWGSASSPNPKASRPDVQCRLFRGRDTDVVIAARPDVHRKLATLPRQYRGMYLNADIDTRKDQAAYTVALDTRGRTPSAVYVYDVKSLRLGAARVAVRGGEAVLATRSPWFMAVFCYGKAPLAADIDVATPVAAGARLTLRTAALGPDGATPRGSRAVRASLRIPGFGVSRAASVPGEVQITVPASAKPGSYVCTLSGAGLLGSMRFLEVR